MVVLLLALLLASVRNSGKCIGILDARILRWLGDASYSIYIFQILPFMVAVSLSETFVAVGLGGFRFQVIATLFAIGGGLLVHRRVDVPARAALRRVPDLMMVFAAADRVPKMRFTSLTPSIALQNNAKSTQMPGRVTTLVGAVLHPKWRTRD
jgi:peptidoglycan/LPS O-acetylase OafA/YrhL